MAGKREGQMKEITERLEQGVKDLFTSEKYTEYLRTMSQFHDYSFNNTLLIAMQKPESTLVAGYGTWRKKFNRQVKRGEKGIQIIAPVPIKMKEEIEKVDPETNEPVLRTDGQPETEEVEYIIPRFHVITVFDISQTYGDPIPELDMPELMGSVENFKIFMEAIERVSPVSMRYAQIEGDAKGYYSNVNKEIVIREGMSEKQIMKTAVHETTHAMCHDLDVMEELRELKNRTTKEVEAESVAYTVCSFFGLDTSDYSFPYIARWSSDTDMKELRASMEFIRKTAATFIDGMVENIQKLQREKPDKEHLEENEHLNENLLFNSEQNRYAIYQLRDDGKGREYLFMGTEFLKEKGLSAQYDDYKMVYGDVLGENETLDSLYEKFNIRRPFGFKGHSLSVSDVVAMKREGEITVHYVDTFGYTELSEFFHQKEMNIEKEKEGQGEVFRELQMGDEVKKYERVEIFGVPALYSNGRISENDVPLGLYRYDLRGADYDPGNPVTVESYVGVNHAGTVVTSFCLPIPERGYLKLGEELNFTGERITIEQLRQSAVAFNESLNAEIKKKEMEEKIQNLVIHSDEELLYTNTDDCYAIFQVGEHRKELEYIILGLDFVKKDGIEFNGLDFFLIYGGRLRVADDLESVRTRIAESFPERYTGHFPAVGDVIVMNRKGKVTAYYLDDYDPVEWPSFIEQRKQILEKEARQRMMGEEANPTLDTHTFPYVIEEKWVDDYLDFRKLSLDCKKAIEDAIEQNFDGMHLAHDAARGVLKKYGAERVTFILVNTLRYRESEKRYSVGNKAWAKEYKIPKNINRGKDMNTEYMVDCHPIALDEFIDLIREGIQEQKLNPDIEIQINRETKGFIADGHFGTWYTIEEKEIRGEMFYRMEHEKYGDSVASIIVNQQGKVVAEDVEYHGFDQGVMDAIAEYFTEKGTEAEVITQEDIQKAKTVEKEKPPLISDLTKPERALNGLSHAEIEETVICYAQAQIDGMRLEEEVELLGARVYGSRSREGLYRENSDIDVVVSYRGALKEDVFFNVLHEDRLEIAGIPVDINPISIEKTGTLEEYLESAEKYLDEKQSQMDKPEKSGQIKPEAAITFYVAECMEFPELGEYHEQLETLQKAMELYEKIPSERMNGVKGIGFCLEDGSCSDGKFGLMVMGEMRTEFINEISQYRESPLVQKAISDMQEILAGQAKKKIEGLQSVALVKNKEKSEKTSTDNRNVSSETRKQSVLNTLRQRQARMGVRETEKQGQKSRKHKKRQQEL